MPRIRVFAVLIEAAFACAAMTATADDGTAALSDAEQAFVNQLANRVMVGHFTINGHEDQPHRPERYTIGDVKKIEGDLWTVEARIQYGKVDARVPVPVHMNWAGDTPVLAVTDLTIPLVGSEFSARILFDGDRYAGTWKHGQVGGHMWGILRDAPAPADAPPAAPN